MKAKLVKLPPCAQIQEKKKTQENNATNRGYILPYVSGSLEIGKILRNIAVCNQGHKTKYIHGRTLRNVNKRESHLFKNIYMCVSLLQNITAKRRNIVDIRIKREY